MSRTLLIDGDILVYQFASNAEEPIHWGDDLWTLHSFADPAKAKLDDYLTQLQETLEADHLILALTDRAHNFRKDLLPSYKSNRAGVRKPLILPELRQHLSDHYETFIRPGLEGDDILGILGTRPDKTERIIISIDKDMKTIPGLHYNTAHPDEGVFQVDESEADYWHLYQTLVGDTTDGYKGCPGVGPVKAESILADVDPQSPEAWERVLMAYLKAKLTEEDALVQARVARILRASDYDFKKKEPILWSPKISRPS